MRKGELATFLQARVRAIIYRKRYLRMRAAAIKIAAQWRRIVAKRLLVKRRWAASVLRM